jgi:ABC-type nitrate/sulfonate/bicarbonate transport system permease component
MPGQDPRTDDRRRLREVYAWIVLLGVYSLICAWFWVPLLLTPGPSSTPDLVVSIFLAAVGLLVLARLGSAILDRRAHRPED